MAEQDPAFFTIRPPDSAIRPRLALPGDFYVIMRSIKYKKTRRDGTGNRKEQSMAKNQKKPTKYGMTSNSLFMVREALACSPPAIWLAVLQALLAVALSILELYASPAILKSLERHAALEELLLTIGFFVLGIMGVSALSAYVAQNQMSVRSAVRASIIYKIWSKAGTCSYPLRESQDFIRLNAKANDATFNNASPAEQIWDTFAKILQNLLGFSIYLFLLMNVDFVIVAVTMAAAVTGYLATGYLNGWSYRHRQEEADIKNHFFYMRGKANDRYLAKDIRIFGMREWFEELLDKYMKMYQDYCVRGEKVYLLADFADIALTFLRNGIAYFYLLRMTFLGELGAAQFLLYFTAVSGFTAWISGIMGSFSVLHRQSLGLSSVREYLDYEEPFLMEEGEALVPEKGKEYTIELKDVTFRYPGSEKAIFSHLNLSIHPGEKLAVVGPNGAGKTTLVKLICGFYDPDEGEVLLNGRDIRAYNRRDYYKLVSGVFQDFSLLAAEVAENVAQTNQDIDMDRVRDCIEKAGLREKIEGLPAGYHTHLGKEVYEDAEELSGGELQRLMIARLLYKDSPVIVLDEPTAALDAIAESDIYKRYHELTAGRTSIFISHRLASTRFCDRILLLEDGKIAEEGTHGELLARNGAYARLFEIQSRYYREQEQPPIAEYYREGAEENEQK